MKVSATLTRFSFFELFQRGLRFRSTMRMFFVLFLCILIQIGHSHSDHTPSASCPLLSKDGTFIHRLFDPSKKICCGHKIVQRRTNIECCNGKDTYFSDKQICCNDTVSNKFVVGGIKNEKVSCDKGDPDCIERICCGGRLLPKEDNRFCCDEKYIELHKDHVKNKDLLHCCGKNAVYDTLKEICCDDTIFPKYENIGCCGGEIFNKKKKKCVQNKIMKRTNGTCSDKIYDKRKDTCCKDRLTKNIPEIIEDANGILSDNPDTHCCEQSVISSEETCCEKRTTGFSSHSIPKRPDLKCCGTGSYNVTSQACLNGIPVNISPRQAKCGNVLIDTTIQSCCANKLPYNSSSEKCCEGAFYCIIKKEDHCCNGLQMRDNELCCESTKPCKKREMEDNECCFDRERNNAQTYNKQSWSCRNGNLEKIRPGSMLCGLEDYYDPKEYFCCGEKKYKLGNGQCCNGIYSDIPPEKGRCCTDNNRAYKFDDPTNPCIETCNERETYDISTELCCGGKKFKYTGHNYCCGASAIDSFRTRCCGDQFPYHPGGRKGCCKDTQVYNNKYSFCTQNGKLESKGELRGLTDVQRLCYPLALKLFDGGVQHACMRKHAISGRVSHISSIFNAQDGEFHIHLSLRNVKSLKDDQKVPRRITFKINIAADECQVDHLTKLNRVIVFFDDDLKRKTKTVEILNDSPFFLNPKTFQRYYSVTKAISKNLCKIFL